MENAVRLAVVVLLLIPYAAALGTDAQLAIPRVERVAIDGDVGEWYAQGVTFSDAGRPGEDNTATVRLAYDDQHLFLAAEVQDSEVIATRADDAADLYLDDTIELYIDTQNDGGGAMRPDDFQILVTPAGAYADLRGTGGGKDLAWDGAGIQAAARVQGTLNDGPGDTGFTLELAIPWSVLGVTPVDGDYIALEVIGADADTGDGYQYFQWNGSDTLQPSTWGVARLRDARGDVNEDDTVDRLDLEEIVGYFRRALFPARVDRDADGTVSLFDLVRVARRYGWTYQPPPLPPPPLGDSEPTYNATAHALIDSESFDAFDGVASGTNQYRDKYRVARIVTQDATYLYLDPAVESDGLVTLVPGRGGTGNALQLLYGGPSGAHDIITGTESRLGTVGLLDASQGLPEVAGPYTHFYFTSWVKFTPGAEPTDGGGAGGVKGFMFWHNASQRYQHSPHTLRDYFGSRYSASHWDAGPPHPPDSITGRDHWQTPDDEAPPFSDYNDGQWHRFTVEYYIQGDPSGHHGVRWWLDGTLVFDNLDNVGDPLSYANGGSDYTYAAPITHWMVFGNLQDQAVGAATTPFNVTFDDWTAWTDAPDTIAPVRSAGSPSGTLSAGTTNATLSLTTDEAATCRYSTVAGTSYTSMSGLFTTTGQTTHSTIVTGLANGTAYSYHIRCNDSLGNANTNDYTISFSVASPPSGGTSTLSVDVSQLPLAQQQWPVAGTYGRSLTAGQTYTDPNTGVIVLKLTDASTPSANGGMQHTYSEGGPHISQPWIGADSNTYYTIAIADYLVDVRWDTREVSNWRASPAWGEIGLAFSLDESTPRIAYVVDSGISTEQVQRYNTATDQIENIGNWPWAVSGPGQYFVWLQTQVNDSWVAGMLNSNARMVAWRPADGLERAYTPPAPDEPHLDRELPYLYLAGNDRHYIADLESGAAYTNPSASLPYTLGAGHSSPLRGFIVAETNWEEFGYYRYDPAADQATIFAHVDESIGFPGEYHQAGQWVFGNGVGANQWFVADPSNGAGTRPAAAVKAGFISLIPVNGSTPRLVAAHDSTGNTYSSQPQTTISPDGRLLVWTSNMANSGRTDVFVAFMPTP